MNREYILKALEEVVQKRELLIMKQAELYSLGEKLMGKMNSGITVPDKILTEYDSMIKELKAEADQLDAEVTLIGAIADGTIMEPSATLQ
jgi:hypothetical protein